MAKITVEQLMSKMGDPNTEEADLAQYFVLDEEQSGPFSPQLRLNPETVQIPRGPNAGQRTAAAMNSANWAARSLRQGQFRKAMERGYSGPVIVSEGDSWFQYPVLLKDTIDHLMDDYAIFSLGAAGDLLKRMADKREYLAALKNTGAEILLLSGGGNDLVAGGALASHLEAFDPDLKPEDYLLPSFQALLDDALGHYGRMFRQVHQTFPHVSILCHGYDYPVPNKDRWLGKPMESRGIRDRGLQKKIAVCMMDHFNRRLRRLARSMPHVTYIDCRGTVGDRRWHDGLHPTNAGYRDVAKKFKREIKRISNTRSGPPFVISGPFGTATNLSRALHTPPVIAGGEPNGMSLHLGLNTVDPAHYDGWDGRLEACEADAHAMQALAEAQGFKTKKLLTREATRDRVIKEVEQAAKKLNGGDMFLFTVSAHGGRIPDFNQDEDHDDDANRMDETLCLYDFQLADDELYMLWTQFRAGVRVLVVPDTCHSGSMVRMGGVTPATLFGRSVDMGPKARFMPRHIEDRVWRANEGAYRTASKSYSALKESIMVNPLTSPLQASVLNLGACRDDQYAMDGDNHGAFTEALLKTWDNGRFGGDYRAFRTEIDAEIGSASQTPQLFEKLLRDPNFVTDTPFALLPGAGSSASVAPGSGGPASTGGATDGSHGESTGKADPASSIALSGQAPRTRAERVAAVEAVELPKTRSRRSAPATSSAFSQPVTRSGDAFDPNAELGAHQQSLKAAVSASSVVSFVENLTPGQKEDVLLSTLFAQRAADAKADPVKDRAAWYDVYLNTLSVLGWVREAAPFESSQRMQGNGSFDKIVLATLAQVATGNQFQIVKSAMEALNSLADDDNRIKLFDFETSQTSGGNFQIGSAEAAGEAISMALGAFNFTYKDEKKNILFVSWGANELDYWLIAQKLSLSPTIYADVRDVVKTKLGDTRRKAIADIDIG